MKKISSLPDMVQAAEDARVKEKQEAEARAKEVGDRDGMGRNSQEAK